MQRIFAVLYFQGIRDGAFVVLSRRRNTAHLPARRQLNSYVIELLVGVLKINRVDAVGVFKDTFLRCGEHCGGNQSAFPSAGRPARNL